MAQLRRQEAEFTERGIAIVLVSFAGPELARHWQAATGFTYPLLLDPERRAYTAFGLGSSIGAAWHPKVYLYYLRLLAKGRTLMPLRQDPYQLGGDFLVDRQGTIILAHPGKGPLDRPTVSEILQYAEGHIPGTMDLPSSGEQ